MSGKKHQSVRFLTGFQRGKVLVQSLDDARVILLHAPSRMRIDDQRSVIIHARFSIFQFRFWIFFSMGHDEPSRESRN
jgi:hypothetical protein